MKINKANFFIWFVSILPKTIIYYCANNLVAKMTSGKHSGVIVPELTAMNALKNYANDNNI